MRRIFAHGDLRLYLLIALDEAPRHGYEIIRLLEDRFEGMYTPSAGTIYPRLAALEDEGLVDHVERDDRKVYRITDAGRAELHGRRHDVRRLQRDIERSTRRLADEIRRQLEDTVHENLEETLRGVGSSVRDSIQASTALLQDELHEALDSIRPLGSPRRERRERRSWSEGPTREYLRLLRAELDVFAAEVIDVARRHDIDMARLNALREVLVAARDRAAEAVGGSEASPQAAAGTDAGVGSSPAE